MRNHGEKISIHFPVSFPVNVCSNPDCTHEFIILSVRPNGDVWEQVGNGLGALHCPYCKEPIGSKSEQKKEERQ